MVAHKVLGTATWRVGDFAEGERHQRAQVALAETEGDDWERGHALIDLANTLIQTPDRPPEALELYGAAARLFDQHKDFSAQARVRMNRALLYHNMGELERAHADLKRALEAAERSHSRIWIGYCLLNEALFAAEEGRVEGAQRALARTAELLEPLGDQLAHQQIEMIRGMTLECEGKHEDAEAAYAEALRLARTLGLGGETAEMLFRQAHLRLRRGRREEAERVYGEALAAGLKKLRGDLSREIAEFERALAPPAPPAASSGSPASAASATG
jgi:tetratricopeptide (TPR) repeat protein